MWLYGQLSDRNSRVRKHQQQRHPRTVVKAMLGDRRRNARLGQERRGLLTEFRCTRRAVVDLVKRTRKTVEIVDGLWLLGNARNGLRRAPVCGKHEYRTRTFEARRKGGELGGRHRRVDG